MEATPCTKQVDAVCAYWNKKGIVKHRVFTDKVRRKVKATLKYYTLDEVCKAIFNYATILIDKQYYWTYRWTLHDFLQRGLEKFMDEAQPYDNYKSSYPVDHDRTTQANQATSAYKERFLQWKNASPEERKKLELEWREGL